MLHSVNALFHFLFVHYQIFAYFVNTIDRKFMNILGILIFFHLRKKRRAKLLFLIYKMGSSMPPAPTAHTSGIHIFLTYFSLHQPLSDVFAVSFSSCFLMISSATYSACFLSILWTDILHNVIAL